MTRLIITGRNNAMPRDVAQSMAHLLPTEWASFDDRFNEFMRKHGFDNPEDAKEALYWGYDKDVRHV